MQRTYPPREMVGGLVSGDLRMAFASDQLKVLIDAFRLWPQGLQLEIRTIENFDLFPRDFDVQSLTGQGMGQGLQIVVFSRPASNEDWVPALTSCIASETSAGALHRRRHITTWTPLDVTSMHSLKVVVEWEAAGLEEQGLELPQELLVATLKRCV